MKTAIVQHAPVVLDLHESLAKAVSLIAEAATMDALAAYRDWQKFKELGSVIDHVFLRVEQASFGE